MKINHVEAFRYVDHQRQAVPEQLVVEQALQISINDQPYTITMRTPDDDENLVRGLLYTEGLIPNAKATLVFDTGKGTALECENRMNVTVDSSELAKDDWGSLRSMVSNASCGVCGTREISELNLSATLPPLQAQQPLDIARICGMTRLMQEHQPTFAATGGCHGAATFDLEGNLLCAFEDIGRHNAVDKVIGWLLKNNQLTRAQVMHVSGRVSYEIVNKVYMANIPILLAVSAPSSLAVELSEMRGITLLGFCRDGRATVYSNDQNIVRHESHQGRTACQKI